MAEYTLRLTGKSEFIADVDEAKQATEKLREETARAADEMERLNAAIERNRELSRQ